MASSLPTALVSVTTSGVIGYPIEDAWRAVKDWGDATAFGTRSCLLVRSWTARHCTAHAFHTSARAGVPVCLQCILGYSSAWFAQEGEKEHTIGALRKSEWGSCGRVVERLTGYDVGKYSQCVAIFCVFFGELG